MKNEILCYIENKEGVIRMPKRKPVIPDGLTFGQRLVLIRKAKGYSQKDLAKAIGISNRMLAYYEKQTTHPPTHLLPVIAQTLGVSTDELLGFKKLTKNKHGQLERRVRRRAEQIQELPPHKQKTLLNTIDTFLKGAAA